MSESIFLASLHLTNFATFHNESIHFSPGFNAIIGETGSGKSLILDALQFIFGQRADKKFVRRNSEFSIIEAHFRADSDDIRGYFSERGYPYEGDTVQIKRILYHNGSSKAYLNFQLTSLQNIQHFTRRFVDFVGQFENQKLLSAHYQMTLLDRYGGTQEILKSYQGHYRKLQELQALLADFGQANRDREQRADYIKFQLAQITKLNPSQEREEELLTSKQQLMELKQSQEVISKIDQMVSAGEHGLLSVISTIQTLMGQCPSSFCDEVRAKVESILAMAGELSYEISKMSASECCDGDLERALDELDAYQKLKRKFGGTTKSLLVFFEDFQRELGELDQLSLGIDGVTKELEQVVGEATKIAEFLHHKRLEAAASLGRGLTQKVRKLKMSNATLTIKCEKSPELLPHGMTELAFMAQTNVGESFSQVKEIASGGELSRILLALRQLLSSRDSIAIFLFDEIDAGIGGETALVIGAALQQVAAHSQVIAITHLPQIAHFAHKLLAVNKQVKTSRTHSMIEEYSGEDIAQHVRQMNPLS